MKDQTYLLRQNDKLFEATLTEFSSKSFLSASTNEIIKNAEYNKGSFYYRFKTKEDIYFALIDYVYVQQIALFHQKNIKLSAITDFSELISLLFENLKEVNNLDTRYVRLLRMIYLENIELKDQIAQRCVSSLLDRFLLQLHLISKDRFDNILYKTFEELLLFSYHNSQIDFEDEKLQTYVSNIKQFLLSNVKESQKEEVQEVHWDELSNPLNFLLYQESKLSKVNFEKYTYLSAFLNNPNSLKDIKDTLKIQKVDLENILKSGLKRNLRNYDHLLKLLNLNFYNRSFHLLNPYQKLILLITYLILTGSDFIIVDYVLKFVDYQDIEILFQEILPIFSKTSKIIVLEEEFYVLPIVISNLQYVDIHNQMKPVDIIEYATDSKKSIEVQYIDDRLKLRTLYKNKTNLFLEDFNKYHYVRINATHKISIYDVTQLGV